MKVVCFGEILWDCLPQGKFLGGAPFNVAYHIKQLGGDPVVASAVGRDDFGKEALQRIRAKKISTTHIAEHADLPTGTVNVQLDARGNASYVFTDPAAWDRIPCAEPVLEVAASCQAVVFGSLALRHEFNRESLNNLLAVRGPLKVFDVNLRPPYDDAPLVLAFARRADVLKLNDAELVKLTDLNSPFADETALICAGRELAQTTGCRNICVTRGEHGALWLLNDSVSSASAPRVTVKDTVGAGDAFTAAFVLGLASGEARKNPLALLDRACRLGAFVASCDGAQPEYDGANLG